jgi:hypothetical protein
MVGFANISAWDMLDHLFGTYGNITAVDLEINFEHMRRTWDPQQPVESLFKQIQVSKVMHRRACALERAWRSFRY